MQIAASKVRYVFGAAFLVAFLLQLGIWHSYSYIDQDMWIGATSKVAHGTFPDFKSATPVHPGTALILPAALLMQLPIDEALAYHIALSLLMALGITLCSYACFLLRPQSLWWLGAYVMLAANVAYLEVTTPSALAAVLCVLFALLLLRVREQNASNNSLFWLGLCSGVLLATRLDTGLFFLGFTGLYLLYLAGWRAFLVPATALLFYAPLDPYLYIDAVRHFYEFYLQVATNRTSTAMFGTSKWWLSLPSLAFLFAFVYVYLRPRLTSVPRDYLLWMLAATEAFCILILMSSYQPLRYFFPFMCILEVMLVLFALEYVEQEPSFKSMGRKSTYAVIGFFIFSRAFRAALFYAGAYMAFNLGEFLVDSAATILS